MQKKARQPASAAHFSGACLLGCSLAGLAGVQSAQAEWEGESGPWAYEAGAEAVIVLSAGDDHAFVDRETALFEIGLTGEAGRVLDNGAEIGVRGALRLQGDHPARPGFAGCIDTGAPSAPAGYSGVASCAPGDTGPRGQLEIAHVYIDGGYGELVLGRDTGAAVQAYEGPRTLFSHARAADTLLDPSGLSTYRLKADLTGPSARIGYSTPRLIGIRAGVSFAPEAEASGLDWDGSGDVEGIIRPEISNEVALGANFSRRVSADGMRVRAGIGAVRADIDDNLGVYEDSIHAYSAGFHVSGETLGAGIAYLESNNGLSTGDYTAWSAGLDAEKFGLDWALTYTASDDESNGISGENWQFGGSKDFGSTIVSAGLTYDSLEIGGPEESSAGFVVEITQAF